MQNNIERAKQFMPFDALKGFREMLRFVEKQNEDKKVFSSDFLDILNEKLNTLEKGKNVKVTYFYDLNYIETCGVVKSVDVINQTLILLNTKISFDDIMDIEYI
ncbi:MAG: YolD-like family protein [Bacilli bacterium]|nr:YolD-like family protein [Bacilli bacterium]